MQERTTKMPWTYNFIQYSNRPNLQKNSQQTNRNIAAQGWYFESAKLKLQLPKFKLIQYHPTQQQKFIILNPYYSSLNPQGPRTCVSFFWKGEGRFLSIKAGNQCMCTVMYLHDLDSLKKTQKSTESTRAKLSSALII